MFDFFKNSPWTTLAGILSALAQILIPILGSGRAPTGTELATAAGTAVIGVLAKDFNASGGVKPN